MKNMTKKRAMEIVNEYKDATGYFDEKYGISAFYMYDMFRNRYRFGEGESRVIVAALVIAGAKFKED